MIEFILIAGIAFITSCIAGILGLGGAVILIPAYLYLPSLLGLVPLGMKEISGMTSLQVFASSLLGVTMHRKKGAVDARLVWTMGIPITVSAFIGALLSKEIDPDVIIAVFATMAIAGGAFVFLKRKEANTGVEQPVDFNLIAAVTIALGVGFFGGMVGAPGAFILSPLMLTILRIPTRVTIGSTLGIVLLSALAASTGKIITGQVPWLHTMVAILAALPGVYLGSNYSHQLNTKILRMALAVVIAAVGIQMWLHIVLR